MCTFIMIPYVYLFLLWLLFGLSHSLLATDWWKQWVRRKTGSYFRYYRLSYSFISFLLLVVIVVYHWQVPAVWLWTVPVWLLLVGSLLLLAGLFIMGMSIYKYFFDLSGIAVLFPKKASSLSLETGGMHRFVRHPLYFGTLLSVWAFLLVFPLMSYLVSCVMMTLYTCVGVVFEERKLRKVFGEEYVRYQEQVPMLIPLKL
jgi:protein-S-isoprenylcysteine O-methyltransferase Ste14